MLLVLGLGIFIGLWLGRSTIFDESCRKRELRALQGNPESFDHADQLLNMPNPLASSWGNLGLWSAPELTYPEAAKALARRLAQAAELKAGDSICDLGFGCGDQIRLWFEDFHVRRVSGLNPSSSQNLWAKQLLERTCSDANYELHTADHSALAKSPERWHKILALDCAYHFANWEPFLASAHQHLEPSGLLVLTDLTLGPHTHQGLLSFFLRTLAWMANIPWPHLKSPEAYQKSFEDQGFTVHITDLSTEVFPGIADYLKAFDSRWGRFLRPALRSRYALTAKAAAFAARTGHLRYVLVRAEKQPSP